MPRTRPFEEHAQQYEDWFERHRFAYLSEVEALRSLQGTQPRRGLEIGVGSGRFAVPLGFRYGVEPACAMAALSAERGIATVRGVAEGLPFRARVFDQVLVVTTVCFVDDLPASFREIRRTLTKDGFLLVGLIDRESPLGRIYQERRAESLFYREAAFHSVGEILRMLEQVGFRHLSTAQTLFGSPAEMTGPDPVKEGHGEGSFVAIRAGL